MLWWFVYSWLVEVWWGERLLRDHSQWICRGWRPSHVWGWIQWTHVSRVHVYKWSVYFTWVSSWFYKISFDYNDLESTELILPVNCSWVCDGENDCDDGSDEGDDLCGQERNGTDACELRHGMFPCHDGSRCLSPEHVCDNIGQCGDKSDEGRLVMNFYLAFLTR